MKVTITILLFYLSGLCVQIWSQNSPGIDSLSYLPDIYNESFYLLTDRYIYAVGEKILFRVFNTSHFEIQKEYWSKVLYMELIKPDGTAVIKAKFPLTRNGSVGYIEIPENLLTGNYYVVVYTKWMRNFRPEYYTFNMIKIINPFKSELEESCTAVMDSGDSITTGYSPETIDRSGAGDGFRFENSSKTQEGLSLIDGIKPVLRKNMVLCQTDKNIYHQREKVNVTINIPKNIISSLTGCSVFVVRPGVTDTMVYSCLLPDSSEFENSGLLNYIPEIRGLSISGKVISRENQEPLSGAHVRLSSLNNNPGFSEYTTGENGEFILVLEPLKGEYDIFITADHQIEQYFEIVIDNDFSTNVMKFNNKPFILSELERERAREIIINMQIGKLYNIEYLKDNQSEKQTVSTKNFYGQPSNVVYLDDYIELPTLEEVFIELLPEVHPVIRKKKMQLIIKNEYHSNQSLSFRPLIMVDHLPVSDLEKVMLLPPSEIQRIEVVNELFLHGDFFYGGIISIFTKNNNLGGIELPENSVFFNFQCFDNQKDIKFPEYFDHHSIETNLPDYRNCLFWDPDLKIDPTHLTQTCFYTSDSRGEFVIYLKGVTKAGEIIDGTCRFMVE